MTKGMRLKPVKEGNVIKVCERKSSYKETQPTWLEIPKSSMILKG